MAHGEGRRQNPAARLGRQGGALAQEQRGSSQLSSWSAHHGRATYASGEVGQACAALGGDAEEQVGDALRPLDQVPAGVGRQPAVEGHTANAELETNAQGRSAASS